MLISLLIFYGPVLRSRIRVSEVTSGLTLGFQLYNSGSLLTGINHHGNVALGVVIGEHFICEY